MNISKAKRKTGAVMLAMLTNISSSSSPKQFASTLQTGANILVMTWIRIASCIN